MCFHNYVYYVGGSTTDYTLHVSGYSGTAGDSLAYLFATKNNDSDQYGGNCAHSSFSEAECYYFNLNGLSIKVLKK